jgi:hypothetical protein
VAVGAHDQQIDILFPAIVTQHAFDFAGTDYGGGVEAGGGKLVKLTPPRK